MPNPTEAEAREAVLKAYDDSGESPTFETDEVCDAAFFAALDAYAAAIRSSERERYAALVEAARKAKHHPTFCILRMPTEGCVCGVNALASALAALEEAGSA